MHRPPALSRLHSPVHQPSHALGRQHGAQVSALAHGIYQGGGGLGVRGGHGCRKSERDARATSGEGEGSHAAGSLGVHGAGRFSARSEARCVCVRVPLCRCVCVLARPGTGPPLSGRHFGCPPRKGTCERPRRPRGGPSLFSLSLPLSTYLRPCLSNRTNTMAAITASANLTAARCVSSTRKVRVCYESAGVGKVLRAGRARRERERERERGATLRKQRARAAR